MGCTECRLVTVNDDVTSLISGTRRGRYGVVYVENDDWVGRQESVEYAADGPRSVFGSRYSEGGNQSRRLAIVLVAELSRRRKRHAAHTQ